MEMADVKKRKHRYCLVPQCKTTTVTAPDKIFVSLPCDIKTRILWQKAMRRTHFVGNKTNAFVCEDHFNVINK